MNLEQSLNKVRDYISSGDLDAAQLLTNKMLTKTNAHPDALFLSACVEFLKENYTKAINLFEKILKKYEGNLIARLNLAIALNETERPAEAIPHFEKVLDKEPGNHQAFYNLGNAYYKLDKYQEAKRAYLQAVVLNPNYDLAYNNLGVICKRLNQKEDAIKYFKKAIDLNPSSVPYVNFMALLSKENSPQAYMHALDAVKLDKPGDALMYAYSIFINSCGWGDAEPIRMKMLEHAKYGPVNIGVLEDLLLTINCDPMIPAEDTFNLHQRWGKETSGNITPYYNHNKELTSGKKLKIGYLSPDFNDHSVGMFIRNIIGSHDLGKFEVHCYSKAKIEDAVTDVIKNHATNFINVSKLTDEKIAATIHGDGIHILVDLAGHTTDTAIKALAYRPAPLQMTYLGYPNTTGLDTVDFRITDGYADTEEGTQYTEKLIRMPESFLCFGAFEDRPFNTKPPVLEKGQVTFGSFNHVRKLTPAVIRTWSKILKQVPDSRLIIKGGKIHWESVKRNIIGEFKKNDITEDRIELYKHTDKKGSHLDFYNNIDIALDTFPYNGTTTTCEALWMGVPVIALVGKVHAQRVSYSILKNIGIDETITYSSEEYIKTAVGLATDLTSLEKLRQKIPDALRRSVLCDQGLFTRQLEALYCKAWLEQENKLPAEFTGSEARHAALHTKSLERHDSTEMISAAKHDIENGDLAGAHAKLTDIFAEYPDDLTARFLLGTVKYQLGRFAESIEILSSVNRADPENTSVLINLGTVLQESGEPQKAIQCYEQILRMEPEHYLALNNLANIHKKLEHYDEAQELLERSINNNGSYWISNFNLGCVYAAKDDHINAAKWLRRAIALEKSPLAYAALIISLGKNGQVTEAYQVAKDTLLLEDPGVALVPAWNTFAHLCDWQRIKKIQPRVLEILQQDRIDNMIRQTALLGLNAKADIDADTISRIHRLWGDIEEYTHKPKYSHQENTRTSEKIKVGYLSADFNRHSVGFFISNIIAAHDSNRFEVYCYSSTKHEDSITGLIKEAVVEFTDVRDLAAEEIAAKIHEDDVHILIDLAGHTRGSQLSVLCYRPAPVQITYLGYPNTTGLTAVDYRLSDHYAETDEAERYTEQLLYMPESFLCFGEFSGQPINKVLPVINNNYVTFGSFNNITKLTPEVIRVWSAILNKVSSSKIIIKAERANIETVKQHISNEFSKYGITKDRIGFHGFTADTDSHLAFYNRIDIALDTFPYNGTTTTCEALWMGVPVVTLVGRVHAQRVSYSILKNAGIEDTIAHNEAEYIEKTVMLAQDAKRLQALHEKIPASIRSSILCDPERFTRQFEQILLNAWRLKGNGLDLAQTDIYPCQTEGEPIMTPDPSHVTPAIKPQGQQIAPTSTGLWTDHILKFPYANVLSQIWLDYIESHTDDEAWRYHQLALNNYRDTCLNGQSQIERHASLLQGYQVLYQLADVGGNVSNLQTFSRIAIGLGEYENALFALNYIASIFEKQNSISLNEPFLCVAEKFENVDPGTNIGSWVYASVIYQIENIERQLCKANVQATQDRLEKFKKTGFLDADIEYWWKNTEFKTDSGKEESNSATDINKIRKLHVGGKQVHPEWEIINAVPGPGVDHIGNAKDLSQFPDNCFSDIYGSHVLEHFDYQRELSVVLKEWCRVLKPGGKLYISVPDLDKLASLFINKRQLNFEQRFHVMRMIFGGQIDEYDYHKVGLNREILEVYLKQAGFERVRVVDSFGIFDDTSDYKPYGVAISVNVIAQKPAAKQDNPRRIHTADKSIDVFDDDIFLVSYPRSGNTWLRFLLAMIIKKAKDVDFGNIEKYAPDLYRNNNDSLLKTGRPRIIKSHEIYNPGYPNVIYMIRDVRDVLVSCYHYTLKMGNDCTFDAYLTQLIKGDDGPMEFGNWVSNVRSWLNHRDSICIVKYEDLLTNPENTISKLLDELSIEYLETTVKKAISACSFDNMQKKENKAGNINYIKNNKDIKFVRKGKIGGWREFLTPEHIAIIKSEFGDLMIELGYEKDPEWE